MSSILLHIPSIGFGSHPTMASPSQGTGADSALIAQQLKGIISRQPPSLLTSLEPDDERKPETLPEKLFHSAADLKILLSQVAMHLPQEWRQRIFRQLDRLYDIGTWDPEDTLIQPSSFVTFLRTLLSHETFGRPSLGISLGGNLLAAWVRGDNTLTMDFMAGDEIRWTIVRRMEGGGIESAAGRSPLGRLKLVLSAYEPEVWFGAAT